MSREAPETVALHSLNYRYCFQKKKQKKTRNFRRVTAFHTQKLNIRDAFTRVLCPCEANIQMKEASKHTILFLGVSTKINCTKKLLTIQLFNLYTEVR